MENINRTQVIQSIIDRTGKKVFLEIGVRHGANFLKIKAQKKIAVDPEFAMPGGTPVDDSSDFYEMNSDQFFTTQSNFLAQTGLDVVLVDGLHTYEQSLKDVLNCLIFLNNGGVIVMHDCNPKSESAAHPIRSEAMKMPGARGTWNGDVWKTIVYLRSLRSDLNVFTLECDQGLGMITKGTPENQLNYSEENIVHLKYENLNRDRAKLLNLKSPNYFNQFISEIGTEPKNKEGNELLKFFEQNQGRLINKWMHYFEIYDQHFNRFKNQDVHVLEIGVSHGGSLLMWKDYFGEDAKIYGVDVEYRCKDFESDNIKIFIASQSDRSFLKSLLNELPRIDILIDDGGHTMEQQIITFEELFPYISENGLYLVEDVHTNYWKKYGGGHKKSNSFIEYSKNLIDQLNAWHSEERGIFKIDDFTRSTASIHYYDSVIVIEKRKREQPFTQKTGYRSFNINDEVKLQEMIDSYRKSISLNSQDYKAYKILGDLLTEQSKYQEAIDNYQQALELEENPAVYFSLGNAQSKSGEFSAATTSYKKALELNSRQPFYVFPALVYKALGDVMRQAGMLNDAVDNYQESLKLDRGNVNTYMCIGTTLLQQGKLEEATTAFQQAINLKPNNPQAYYHLGQAELKKRNIDGAISNYQKALKIKPNLIAAQKALEKALKKINDSQLT